MPANAAAEEVKIRSVAEYRSRRRFARNGVNMTPRKESVGLPGFRPLSQVMAGFRVSVYALRGRENLVNVFRETGKFRKGTWDTKSVGL